MGAEVVWIRQFTPYLGTMVYAFAAILCSYLIATFFGSWFYRRWGKEHERVSPVVWSLIGIAMLLPLIAADPALEMLHQAPKVRFLIGGLRVLVGIPAFCALLGFVTPLLVDRWSAGDPDKAGRAYAINVLGCILGPLLSGFILLPFLNERWVLVLFALPWLLVSLNPVWWTGQVPESQLTPWRLKPSYALALLPFALVLMTSSYESRFPKHVVLRDHTATVMAVDDEQGKRLLVNGRGMTRLAVVTKMMAHLPLAFLTHPPQNGLVICFGMGTAFRAMHSWNIDTTAVELVPAVPRLFWYYHPDAAQILSSPLAHVEIDDGRRYLERTQRQFDVITIDPPPPIESAGSSLLYSKEFYSTIKRRLKPGGILQQWLPTRGDYEVHAAIARALGESFAEVRAFYGISGYGEHFLASDTTIPQRTPEELARRMPQTAIADMLEWGPYPDPESQFAASLKQEFSLDSFVAQSPGTPAMEDNRPINEYFLLRTVKRRFRNGLRNH